MNCCKTLFSLRPLAAAVAALCLSATVVPAQNLTQTFALRAGWNSLWLEIDPANREIGAVFTNLPLSSVWAYLPNENTVEFIRDQNEAAFNDQAWLRYFPPGRPESFLNNLFAVHAGRAYLVKVTNSATLTVTGRPVVKAARWVADSFTLRGFPVNPAQLPTFASFFAPSVAQAGQRIYQLGANGQWALVNTSSAMRSGEAYWVFSRGASTYQGPLGLKLELGDGLDYDSQLSELAPRLRNNTTASRTITITDLGSGANGPLSYRTFASNQFSWVNLPAPYLVSLARSGNSNAAANVRLAVRRKDFSGDSYASILEVKDDAGTRYLVPVTAIKLPAARASLDGNCSGRLRGEVTAQNS